MRNYIKVSWVQGDVFDDNLPPNLIETVYGIGTNVEMCNQFLDTFQQTLAPTWPPMTRSPVSDSYILVERDSIVSYFQLTGNNLLVVNKYVYDALKASEQAIVGGTQSPRSSNWGYKSEGGGGFSSTSGSRSKSGPGTGGTIKITLKSYLLLLLNTWSTPGLPPPAVLAPKRWIDWLTLLISHYDRYTPAQIYGFLARVDFSGATFKV